MKEKIEKFFIERPIKAEQQISFAIMCLQKLFASGKVCIGSEALPVWETKFHEWENDWLSDTDRSVIRAEVARSYVVSFSNHAFDDTTKLACTAARLTAIAAGIAINKTAAVIEATEAIMKAAESANIAIDLNVIAKEC